MALLHEALTEKIIGCAMAVHSELGPGLMESVYEQCLAHELACQGLSALRQVPIGVKYRGVLLDCGFRADLIVEGAVILELKSIEKLLSVHEAQLLTYMKLSRLQVGLLINFNVSQLIKGITRRVL